MSTQPTYPFSAIVGQDDFKLALLLNIIDPSLGGVLAMGDRGTGKTTTVRSLSELMSGEGTDFPFVNLPIGATEDRVLGSVNLETLINEKKQVVQPGLLAQADGGILYIDEVNLLNDYLMDVLLDAAATGGYHLEREAISQWMDSRFCLVGTMNPEEGELRPQLLDRFGLAVEITTPQDKPTRMQISERRIAFDTDPETFLSGYREAEQKICRQILNAKEGLPRISIPETCREQVADITIEHRTEGMRADILIQKAARAHAALNSRDTVTSEDVEIVAPLVLHHRSNQNDSGQAEPDNTNSDSGGNSSTGSSDGNQSSQPTSGQNSGQEQQFQPVDSEITLPLSRYLPESSTRGNALELPVTKQGIKNPDINQQDRTPDIPETVRHYLVRNTTKIHYKTRKAKTGLLLLFLVDSSGSMAKNRQIAYIKGIISQTLEQHKHRRIQYALVSLSGGEAQIQTRPTPDQSRFLDTLTALPTGGKTNMHSGVMRSAELIRQTGYNRPDNRDQVNLYIFTDGKFNTGGRDPFQSGVSQYRKHLKGLQHTEVIDTETSFVPLHMAKQFADAINANYRKVTV